MTHGYVLSDDKEALLKRLRRIEGQVRGLQRMVDEERYCIDILTQVSAATAALERVAMLLVSDHVRHCVRTGGEERVDELMAAVERLVRSG
jgi:DNA-binding FrmR family transcriptional regulator